MQEPIFTFILNVLDNGHLIFVILSLTYCEIQINEEIAVNCMPIAITTTVVVLMHWFYIVRKVVPNRNGIFLRHFALEMAPVDFCPFFRVMVVGRVPPPKADE